MLSVTMQYALVPLVIVVMAYVLQRRIVRKTSLDRLPGPPSSSWISGNMLEFCDRHGWSFHTRITQDFGTVVKLHGMLNEPIPYVFDPAALHHMFVTESSSFEQSPEAYLLFRILAGPGMIAVPGDVHRRQRRIINPAFSFVHLRRITPILYEIALEQGAVEMDIYSYLSRVALELIGQGGLCYSFDPLTEEGTPDQFGHDIKRAISLIVEMPILRLLLPSLTRWTSSDFPRRILRYSPMAHMREFARLSEALIRRSKEICEEKKLAMQQGDETLVRQVGMGKDILSLLVKANNAAAEKDRLSECEVVGQLIVMAAGGMDTIANATARVLHCLALRPDIQNKLREELLEVKCNDVDDFDRLMQLPWLDAIIKETLRLYSPVPFVLRTAVKDTVLPLSRPIHCTDGATINEIPMPKGTKVFVGVYGSNLNKDLWGDDALEWKPERWLKEMPVGVNTISSIYSNLMTFVAGPRSCIGFKYAEVEMKILLSALLSHFTFELAEKPIDWKFGHVIWPTASHDAVEGQLFLKVSLANSTS